MRIAAVEIENFRAVSRSTLEQLPDVVVIAGPNGCGKSCLFDALRLFKSAYGGYSPNEWQSWFGEFQINLDRSQPELLSLFRDRSRRVRIQVEILLENEERRFLSENAERLLRPLIWDRVAGGPEGRFGRQLPVAAQIRTHGQEVDDQTNREVELLRRDLALDHYRGELLIEPNLSISISDSPTLQLVFSLFQPEKVGIIDYHSAQRGYNREQVGSINLSIESSEQQYSQHALYNFAAKYQNIKAQMAASYIRELLMREAKVEPSSAESLINTLREMFHLFFPDKEFLGPIPTGEGRLLFPVRTQGGMQHDINDLSSGEKEVLYGYLRLRNVAPRNSVLLLDEPELHLNPGLIRGLPQFYHRHLGKAFGNQIWLLTHSDALLREAVGQDGFLVVHMQQAHSVPTGENQLRPVTAGEDIERAVIDLVGDLAAYRPGAKVVIFEGGGNTDFDVTLTSTLFPDFAAAVNLISGTNKGRVRELHALLQRAGEEAELHARFYSVVDRDSDISPGDRPARALEWDVYHIENYLLDSTFIETALRDALGPKVALTDQGAVENALAECARDILGGLAARQLEDWANKQLVQCIRTGSDRGRASSVPSLRRAVEGSVSRLKKTSVKTLSAKALKKKEDEIRGILAESLRNAEWRRTFPGRALLSKFVSQHGGGLSYEVLRNLIIAKMRDADHRPPGMKRVIDEILAD